MKRIICSITVFMMIFVFSTKTFAKDNVIDDSDLLIEEYNKYIEDLKKEKELV